MYDQAYFYGGDVYDFNRQNAQPLGWERAGPPTGEERGILLGWLRNLASKGDLLLDTWALAAAYVDLYRGLSPERAQRADLEGLSLAALHSASLLLEVLPPSIAKLDRLATKARARVHEEAPTLSPEQQALLRVAPQDISALELELGEVLGYRYRVPTVVDFLYYFGEALALDAQTRKQGLLLGSLAILAEELLIFHPALLAAACFALLLPGATQRLAQLSFFAEGGLVPLGEASIADAQIALAAQLRDFSRERPPWAVSVAATETGKEGGPVLAELADLTPALRPRHPTPPRSPPPGSRPPSPLALELAAFVPRKEAHRERLGGGVFGEVFGYATRAGGSYAVKRFEKVRAKEGLSYDFAADASALLQLSAKHVMKAVEVGVAGRRPFAAMERCQTDLDRLIHEDWPPANNLQLLRIIGAYTRQMLEGLAYIHGAGLIHCDLKPANVLICGDRAKLADFGIAQWQTPPYRPQTSEIYTPAYRPVEHFLGDKTAKPSSDLWALGCVVVEMLTRAEPFDCEGLPDSIFAKLGRPSVAEWPQFAELATQKGITPAQTLSARKALIPADLGWPGEVVARTLIYGPQRRTPAKLLLFLPH